MELMDSVIKKTMNIVHSGIEKLSNLFVNDEIAKASMIIAAWVTAADGEIKDSEVEETEKYIEEAEYFKDKDKEGLKKEYLKWCNKFIKDPEDAIVYALMEINSLKDTEQALPAVQLAVKIANADGQYSEKEQKVVTKACHYLGVCAV